MFMGRFIFSISISVRCNILLLLRYIFIMPYVRAHASFSAAMGCAQHLPTFGNRFRGKSLRIYGAVFINTNAVSEIYFPNGFHLYLCCTMYTRRTGAFSKVGFREREREHLGCGARAHVFVKSVAQCFTNN